MPCAHAGKIAYAPYICQNNAQELGAGQGAALGLCAPSGSSARAEDPAAPEWPDMQKSRSMSGSCARSARLKHDSGSGLQPPLAAYMPPLRMARGCGPFLHPRRDAPSLSISKTPKHGQRVWAFSWSDRPKRREIPQTPVETGGPECPRSVLYTR